eukprot:m.188307 g.188307  ORF g.188307 m.188307 type:complete len:340 (-) comp17534_c0_seq2:3162-4181(-)
MVIGLPFTALTVRSRARVASSAASNVAAAVTRMALGRRGVATAAAAVADTASSASSSTTTSIGAHMLLRAWRQIQSAANQPTARAILRAGAIGVPVAVMCARTAIAQCDAASWWTESTMRARKEAAFLLNKPVCSLPAKLLELETTERVIVRLADVAWLLLGFGWMVSGMYVISGVVLCATIVGVPFGLQCLRLTRISLLPLKRRAFSRQVTPLAVALNILWLPAGIALSAAHLALAVLCVATVIGSPYAVTHLSLARIAICPFGLIDVPVTPLSLNVGEQQVRAPINVLVGAGATTPSPAAPQHSASTKTMIPPSSHPSTTPATTSPAHESASKDKED